MTAPPVDGRAGPAARTDGYAAIEDYAVLGDGRTAALVATDGRIDWLATPTIDAPPVLSALLDPAGGGHFVLAPTSEHRVARRYLPGTNVVETTYRTAGGAARVVDALNTGSAGRLPWTELVRRVEGIEGRVEMAWSFRPGDRFGAATPELGRRHVWTLDDQLVAIVADPAGATVATADGPAVAGRITAAPGRRAVVGLVATDGEPLLLPSPAAVDERLDRTVAGWRRWSDLVVLDGRWQDAVVRSALALKTVIAERSGAIAAAATTSLPERVGGDKNWDYRFAWVRDSSFTLDALINLGLHEEVHGAVSWLLAALRRSGGRLHVLYTLSGGVPAGEETADVAGYRGSRPVRSGNGAASQSQLGCYGDLLDTVHRCWEGGHVLDAATADLLTDLVEECRRVWREEDSGIWELPDLAHYTISKIGCWVAFDRAARMAGAGALPARRADAWRREADAVRAYVDGACWSDDRQAYTLHAGTDRLDAAVLLAARTGYDRGPRLSSTIDAVVSELGRGPLLYRYSGMEREEGAFVACTFWLVEALAAAGRVGEATELMERAVGLVNDVGLLSEQIDVGTGAFLGNIPQGLSHLALVNAAFALLRAGVR